MTPALRSFAKAFLLVGGLVAAAAAIRALPGDAGPALAERIATGGPWIFVALAALACAAGVPRHAAAFAAGFVFGVWKGIPLALAAALAGAVIDFYWARAIAREWAVRRVRGRAAKLIGLLTAHTFTTILSLRLLPMSNNVATNLAAGVSGAAVAPFLAASIVGYLPHTVIFALLGSGVQVERSAQIVLSLLLLALAGVLGAVLFRRGAEQPC